MSDKKYDAIIIGGGHNVLGFALLIANKINKVLICEAWEK